MLFPALLPNELSAYQNAVSTDQLYELLVKNPSHLLLFFQAALDDETWSEANSDFIRSLLTWLTLRTYQDRLDPLLYEKAVAAMRKHAHLLQDLIPENVVLQLNDRTVQVNSLLLGSLSDFFLSLVRLNARENKEKTIFLRATYQEFFPFEIFMKTGEIPEINTLHQEELLTLLQWAKQWNVLVVGEQCQKALCKYISRDNVTQFIILAHKERLEIVKQRGIELINLIAVGFFLYVHFPERLGFSFDFLNDKALQAFEDFKNWVTDLSLPFKLSEQVQCEQLLRDEFPSLLRLDLSRSESLGVLLNLLPKNLQELDLSDCPWVHSGILKSIATACPTLDLLSLCSNGHLTYVDYGELVNFTKLSRLDLSQTKQLGDKEFTIILKASPQLVELHINECSKIEDESFFMIGRFLPHVMRLSLSHCQLSDQSLIELAVQCNSLLELDISQCERLTEKGVIQLLKNALRLQQLNLRGCALSEIVVNQLRHTYPSCLIIF